MEEQYLRDKYIYPSNDIIKEKLESRSFDLYLDFIIKLENNNLVVEWHYYNDGKQWLGKILNKSKNIGWLSIWNTGFKITVFLTEKTKGGFNDLNISEEIKESIIGINSCGKLIPVVLLIDNNLVLEDVINILKYKKTIK